MNKNNILTLIITLIITSSCASKDLNKQKSEREVQRDKKLNELEQTCDYVTIDIYQGEELFICHRSASRIPKKNPVPDSNADIINEKEIIEKPGDL
jgi:hypothetical protein